MSIKTISLEQTRPTDTLRTSTQEFYDSLTSSEFKKFISENPPQVWKINGQLYISDGNNGIANAIKRGIRKIPVDYQENATKEFFLEYLEEVIDLSEKLQQKGVYTPSDLWNI